ncbi:restriction endonuclease subunit S [uncultured Desulfovibrio sp.]|uniref:restriction endonuclease subunit S n=1 Tax=uncultured Desulfovibrio sp. TaxID=167968 RepID=UPI00262857F4|nr:restriction endonuclease subunit S [uncultured Desulfovibrio sp.]
MMARPRKNAAASRASLLPESAPLPEIPVREQPYPLPEGWKWVRLGDCNHYAGETINPALFQEDIFELYSVPSCITGYPEILSGKEIGSSKQSVEPGDVLLCKINPRINRVWRVVGYTANRLAASSEWIVFRNKDISSKYMMLCMQSAYFREYMLSNVSGVGGSLMRAQPKHVRRYPIPLPPREEQERIVGHIESLFARLDEARQKAEAVRDSVALRRAAILHKAFTGELTAKWREEQGVECWPLTTLHKVSSLITKGASPKWQGISYVEDETQTLFVTSENVREGYLKFENKKFVEDSINIKQKRSCLKYGDILINIVGASIGRAAVYQEKYKANINQAVCLVRLYENISSSYVCYYLNSPAALTYYFENKAETARANLSLTDINNITLPLPTLPEQREIVRILDDLLGREQRIREAADAVVAHIERMKKAILARAFRGELGRADCPSRP